MKLEDEISVNKYELDDVLNEIKSHHRPTTDISKECLQKGAEIGVETAICKFKQRIEYYVKQVLDDYRYRELNLSNIDEIANDIKHKLFW